MHRDRVRRLRARHRQVHHDRKLSTYPDRVPRIRQLLIRGVHAHRRRFLHLRAEEGTGDTVLTGRHGRSRRVLRNGLHCIRLRRPREAVEERDTVPRRAQEHDGHILRLRRKSDIHCRHRSAPGRRDDGRPLRNDGVRHQGAPNRHGLRPDGRRRGEGARHDGLLLRRPRTPVGGLFRSDLLGRSSGLPVRIHPPAVDGVDDHFTRRKDGLLGDTRVRLSVQLDRRAVIYGTHHPEGRDVVDTDRPVPFTGPVRVEDGGLRLRLRREAVRMG